ncbi:hypothetical protein EIM50_17620 [Pseudoxanthomonas sp. SGD-10]|nr:hypothetical protein EIM50_17620 [Pseudoxanthomonas sp. SGD-10]
MAVLDSRGRIRGKIGNVVYRTVGNTSIIQSRPGKVRQTLSTRESALEFGLVSNCGRILRDLYSTFTSYSDGRLLNRMNAALLKCLRDTDMPRGERDLHDGNPEHLQGLQFNINSPLTEALAVRPECVLEEGKVRVHIPEFREYGQLQQPRHSKACVLRMMVAAINFREGYYEYLAYKDIAIERGATVPQQHWQPEVALPAGSMVLVSVSLHYFGMRDINGYRPTINSVACSPAEIIGAFKVADRKEEQVEPEQDVVANRHPLINYRGSEILNKISGKRKQDKKYQERLVRNKTGSEPVKAVEAESNLPVTGKVFYRKE